MKKIENFEGKLSNEIKDIKSKFNKRTGIDFLFIDKRSSGNPSKKHEIMRSKLDDNFGDKLAELFKDRIEYLEKLLSEKTKIKRFLTDVPSDIPSYFQPSELTFMDEFTQNLMSPGRINDFKLRKKFTGFGVHFTIPKNEIFCFTNVKDKTIVTFKKKFPIRFRPNFQEGILEYTPGGVFLIDKEIHCLYFKKLKVFVVFNRDEVEKLFGFNDYYDWISKKQIEHLDKSEIIHIDTKTMSELEHHPQLLMRIAQMKNQDKFNRDQNYYKRVDVALEEFRKKGALDELKFDFVMKDGRVLTNNVIRLSSFLAVTAERVTRHLLEKDVLLLANWVEQITKRSRPKHK